MPIPVYSGIGITHVCNAYTYLYTGIGITQV